jgi:cytochrome c oxidase subunit II
MNAPPLLLLGQQTHNLSIFDPVSPSADSIRSLSYLVLAITGAIFVVVEIILVYSILRFRRKPTTTSTEPPQVYGSSPIEIAWTAAPALIVFVIVLVVTRTLWEVKATPPEPHDGDDAVFVTVTGRQWWWEYRYDYHNGKPIRADGGKGVEADLITANELHMPPSTDGRPRRVYVNLNSADVAHSYWVPRLNGKTDLIPGRVNHILLQTDKPGLYVGQCAEYCGTQHANMLLRVVVHDTPEDFEKWLDNEQKPAVEARWWQLAYPGQQIFLNNSCVNCHRVRGTPARGNYAPDLTHLMSRKTLAAGMIDNDEKGENLDRWIEDPQKVKPGCLMPAFGLGGRDRKLMVKYLRTLK